MDFLDFLKKVPQFVLQVEEPKLLVSCGNLRKGTNQFLMDDVAARQRRKREYIRTFMQEYRGKQRQDKETLQAQIDRLEARVARYRKNTVLDDDSGSGMLPWKDVAAGLHDSRSEASKDQRALSSRIKEYEQVLSELRSFVIASIAPQKSPSIHTATWRDVTLLSHPTSRRLGKLWITQQMRHNMDRLFEHHEIPSPESMTLYNSMDVVFHEEGHHFLQKAHLTWECSLETAVRLYRHHTGSMFTLDGFCPMHSQSRVEVEENTTLHQYKRPNGWNTHLLCGEFQDGDRTILVAQHILSDEDRQHHAGRQRSRMTWYVSPVSVLSS
ncbi:hypothetical protein AaE_001611 [Aphanomyces astaci]|uniref:Uncharacterized protein n=1 Tax=Aphanomyces astaci TaxID=112090 RepID=A0A6A5AW63_APHAT|nr:hypothetical protein AaE_001611 [Aphanomyces astaci]